MAVMTMRRKANKSYPPPPQKFKSLAEVADWANKLYRALSETHDDSYAGHIMQSTSPPTSADGRDGDIWIQYEA